MTLAFSLEPRSERPVPANRPLPLDDPGTAWIVLKGRVQVFALRRDTEAAAREPLFTVGLGELIVPPPAGTALGLLVVGLEDDTVVGSLPLAELAAVSADGASPEVVQLIETWLDLLTSTLEEPHPIEDGVSLVADEAAEIPLGGHAWPATRLVWVPSDGNLRLFDQRTAADVLLPLPPQAWVESTAAVTVIPVAGSEALGTGIGWAGVTAFQEAYLERLRQRLDEEAKDAAESLERRRVYEEELRAATYTGLGAVLGGELPRVRPGAEGGAVLAALQLVGEAIGVEILPPPRGAVGATVDPVDTIARASGVRTRKIVFEGAWWKVDSGPALAWLKADDTPVAVVPRRRSGYEIVDPADGSRTRVDEETAKLLDEEGYMLYRPLPAHPLTGRDVVRFMLRPLVPDLRRLGVYALVAAGLSLLTPVVTKKIFSDVVPGLQRSNLIWLTLLLVVFAVSSFMFALAQQIAFLRVQGRGSTDVQAALWDRVLDLPLPFFRAYPAASLAMRVMGLEQIRLLATSVVVTAVLAIPIGVANLVLAFIFSPTLGLFGAGALLIVSAVMVLLIRYQVPRQRRVQEATNDLFGVSLQLVEAVGKLRVADASRRGFAEWGNRFMVLKKRFYEAQLGFASVTAFTAAAPALGTLLLIVGATTLKPGSLSGATFLAFNTAFIQALAAITGLTAVATFAAQAVPLWENTRPVLQSERETDEVKADPGELRGLIEMSHVSFRYAEDGPLILDDVSFTAEPGEFVAFVGPSGAGKSSVMRILLGFETPELGTTRYDGKDLDSLDPRALRRQMGVVTQSARLMAGDIFTNIVGARPLSVEDAWEAAEIAGIKETIEELPMGMHTFVSEGAGTFSGGQRQRLLIARAVVGRPRVLLFDEATSALDNKTQAAVSEAIEHLRATRIVIAHRLSTVRAADRIVVLQAGKIVQQGTYDELIEVDGVFRRLAMRQLA